MSENDIYNIKKPLIKDDNWFIFPDSVFSQTETMDCNDTIEGKCYTDKTFDECVKTCDKSSNCNYGYYISDLPGKNICVPLYNGNNNSNPIYRLRRKGIYDILEKASTKTFIDKRIYPFPPEEANTLFFMDNFNIQNVETKKLLKTDGDYMEGVQFTKNGDLIVQMLKAPADLSAGAQYVPVRYGDPFVFNIPNTTLIMQENNINNEMQWVPRTYTLSEKIYYNIKPIMEGKKIGDIISLSDTFSIHKDVSILAIDDNSKIVKLYYETYSKSKDKNEDTTFRFIPKMKGWYCDNDNKCKEISLEKMTINDKGIGTYKGLPVGRNPGCWGVCKYKVLNKPLLKPFSVYKENDNIENNPLIIIIPSIIILLVIVILLLKFS
jgi:hypothetical protein